jgi:hypothetical protein
MKIHPMGAEFYADGQTHRQKYNEAYSRSLFAILRTRLKVIETGEDGAVIFENPRLVQESYGPAVK